MKKDWIPDEVTKFNRKKIKEKIIKFCEDIAADKIRGKSETFESKLIERLGQQAKSKKEEAMERMISQTAGTDDDAQYAKSVLEELAKDTKKPDISGTASAILEMVKEREQENIKKHSK